MPKMASDDSVRMVARSLRIVWEFASVYRCPLTDFIATPAGSAAAVA